MDRFHAIDIHLPALTAPSPVPSIIPHRPYQGQQDPHTSLSQHLVHLISLDPDKRNRYAVWLEGDSPLPMGGFGPPVAIKAEERVIWERPVDVSWSVRNEGLAAAQAGASNKNEQAPDGTGKKGKARDDEPDDGGSDHWERETNLKLFGGLLSLRLESKKH